MRRRAADIWKREDGAVLVEYAFIAALVSLAAVLAFEALGFSVRATFDLISSGLAESILGARGS